MVGDDLAVDLAMLQDKMATFPKAEAMALVEASLGRPIEALYARFDEAVAAASIAQVHPAEVLRDGVPEQVAVKVIRPGVRRRFQQDLQSYFLAARLQEKYFPSTRRLRPVQVTETLAQTTRIEMDLRLEAAALSILAENTAADPGFRVPKVDWERTGGDVLTMEWIDGIKMSDVEGLRAAGHDSAGDRREPRPVVPAPHAARRLLPRRHASGKPVRRCVRHHRGSRSRHFRPARAQGAPLPGRDPLRLHHARLPQGGRGAFRSRLRTGQA